MTIRQNNCHFHPNTPSQFYCGSCGTHYCPECVTWRQSKEFVNQYHFMCPRCNVELEVGGIGYLIEPFWRRLPKFFKYPFSPEPLAFIAGFSLLTGITAQVPFFYGPMYILCLFFLFQYCNLIFQQTIKGVFTPPSTGDPNFENEFLLIGKQVLLFLLLTMSSSFLVDKFGLSLGLLAKEVGQFFLPAIFILFLVNRSLRSAINPIYISIFLKKIGWHYLLLYCFTILLMSGSKSVYYLLVKLDFPEWLNLILLHGAESYYFIVMYHMMGYVVLQYHEEFGHKISFIDFMRNNFGKQFLENKSFDPLLNDAHFLLSESKPGEALEMIRKETQGKFINPDLAMLYVKLLKLQGESSKLKFTGAGILELLVEEKRMVEADTLYRQCVAEVPGFTAPPTALLGLFHYYGENKEHLHAFQCGILYAEKLPQDYNSPTLYLAAAEIALKHLKDRQSAAMLFEKFIEQYPEHNKAPIAQKGLSLLRS